MDLANRALVGRLEEAAAPYLQAAASLFVDCGRLRSIQPQSDVAFRRWQMGVEDRILVSK